MCAFPLTNENVAVLTSKLIKYELEQVFKKCAHKTLGFIRLCKLLIGTIG